MDEDEVIDTPEAETLEPVTETPAEPEGDLVVQIGDEEPEAEPEQAPEWVRDLRKRDRENQKRIKELEAQLNKPAEVSALGPKPRFDDPDIDCDEDIFEQRLLEWNERKRKIDEERLNTEKQQEQAQQAWQAKVQTYTEAKAKVPFPDFDDAEAFVQDTFDVTQQGLLIKVAKDAPTLIYALGKNPKKAAELAGIKDYAEFVAESVRLELNVKTTRKPATSPERTVSVPTGTGVASTDNTLERLRERYAKSGSSEDMKLILEHKRSMRV